MITLLTATTTDRIVSEVLAQEGSSGRSRVLTLVISTDAAGLEEALEAAHGASRDHPCRVIAVVAPPADQSCRGPRCQDGHVPADSPGHLDAEIRVGHDAGAGETLVLRPWGEAAEHPDTLVVPFLLPDVPVVAWWPTTPPPIPSQDPLGRLASTRITNTPSQSEPDQALAALAPVHVRGDIDLAWTRITLWRAMVASTLDDVVREQGVSAVEVSGEPGNSSLSLMVSWLRLRLGVPVSRRDDSEAVGVSRVTATTPDGEVVIARQDQDRVLITRPGAKGSQVVTMARREPVTTMNEELRRLTPDLVYEEVLAAFARDHSSSHDHSDLNSGAARIEAAALALPAAQVVVGPDLDAAAESAAQDTAVLLAQALRERGSAHLVLTGGSGGQALAQALPRAMAGAGISAQAMSGIHLWFGDERFVAAGDPERNDVLVVPLSKAGVLEANVHSVPGPERVSSLAQATAWLEEELAVHGPADGRLDVVHLGMGSDAHVCSLFPGHPAALSTGARAVAVEGSPKPPPQRVSFTFEVVHQARVVMVVVGGQGKTEAVAKGLGAPDVVSAPASCARGAVTTWYLDEAAAQGVPA